MRRSSRARSPAGTAERRCSGAPQQVSSRCNMQHTTSATDHAARTEHTRTMHARILGVACRSDGKPCPCPCPCLALHCTAPLHCHDHAQAPTAERRVDRRACCAVAALPMGCAREYDSAARDAKRGFCVLVRFACSVCARAYLWCLVCVVWACRVHAHERPCEGFTDARKALGRRERDHWRDRDHSILHAPRRRMRVRHHICVLVCVCVAATAPIDGVCLF